MIGDILSLNAHESIVVWHVSESTAAKLLAHINCGLTHDQNDHNTKSMGKNQVCDPVTRMWPLKWRIICRPTYRSGTDKGYVIGIHGWSTKMVQMWRSCDSIYHQTGNYWTMLLVWPHKVERIKSKNKIVQPFSNLLGYHEVRMWEEDNTTPYSGQSCCHANLSAMLLPIMFHVSNCQCQKWSGVELKNLGLPS